MFEFEKLMQINIDVCDLNPVGCFQLKLMACNLLIVGLIFFDHFVYLNLGGSTCL